MSWRLRYIQTLNQGESTRKGRQAWDRPDHCHKVPRAGASGCTPLKSSMAIWITYDPSQHRGRSILVWWKGDCYLSSKPEHLWVQWSAVNNDTQKISIPGAVLSWETQKPDPFLRPLWAGIKPLPLWFFVLVFFLYIFFSSVIPGLLWSICFPCWRDTKSFKPRIHDIKEQRPRY